MKRLFGYVALASGVMLVGCLDGTPTSSGSGYICPQGVRTPLSPACVFDEDCEVGQVCDLDTSVCCTRETCSSSHECEDGFWCVVDEDVGSACKSTRDCSQVVDDVEGFCRDELRAPADASVVCDIERSRPECVFTTP